MEKLLIEYINRYATEKFEWGSFDCFKFTAGWVDMVSELPIELGSYDSELNAARRLKEVMSGVGVSNSVELFDNLFYRKPTGSIGDITLLETGKKGLVSSYQAGILNTKWTFVTVSTNGLVVLSVDNKNIWSIR